MGNECTKKALVLTSVASMVDQFLIPSIKLLQSMGYEVDVAANFDNPGTITHERAESLLIQLSRMQVSVHKIDVPRSLKLGKLISAYNEIRLLAKDESYMLVHCHSPFGGALCRLAFRKERHKGTEVLYTAHGFHFYTGAPLKNWLFYFPVEWVCSWWTDVLICITREDYIRARRRLHAKKTEYVPGVGIDTSRFSGVDGNNVRAELGLRQDDKLLLSVGELNANKNHRVVIRALASLPSNLHYAIAGEGSQREKLLELAEVLGVSQRLHLLGYRNDIPELMAAADVYVLPSLREGLNVSLMEAIASGLPCVCRRIRGNVDLIINGKNGVLVEDNEPSKWTNAILHAMHLDLRILKNTNSGVIVKISNQQVNNRFHAMYK